MDFGLVGISMYQCLIHPQGLDPNTGEELPGSLVASASQDCLKVRTQERFLRFGPRFARGGSGLSLETMAEGMGQGRFRLTSRFKTALV